MNAKELIEILKGVPPETRIDLMIDDFGGEAIFESSDIEICHADGEDGYIEIVSVGILYLGEDKK